MLAPILYYITDRRAFPGDSSAQRESLFAKVSEAARAGADYIQLREKDLTIHELEALAVAARNRIDAVNAGGPAPRTNLLINSRADVAIAIGADGVHLPANDLNPMEVRNLWKKHLSGEPGNLTISVSCHTLEDVARAAASGADLAIFAPVFEKKDAPETKPAGLDALRRACLHKIPIIALGGITLENAGACLDAGAAGIAGIRLFQDHDIAEIVAKLGR
jgi:thiamine-phosphate pyrophosphorylase